MRFKKQILIVVFRSQGHMKTLKLVFGIGKVPPELSGEISSNRFEDLLEACKAIEHKTNGNGWRLRLKENTSTISGPERGSSVSLATIRLTRRFLNGAGLTPETVADFLV